MSVEIYIATVKTLLASRETATHDDGAESMFTEQLDDIWLGMAVDEQRRAETELFTLWAMASPLAVVVEVPRLGSPS